jgi:pimeloyl-ACP methyl ester carboxylesterase
MSAPSASAVLDGLAVHERPGEGDAILWLHGYTLDSSSWQEIWARLPGWRHIGVDLPGHGSSRPLHERDDLRSLAASLGRLIREQRVRHVVALSFGTVVGLQVAIDHPSTLASLTLAAPALAGGPQDPDVELLYGRLAEEYHARGPGPHLRRLWMGEPPFLFEGARRHPERWQALCALIDRHRWLELEDGAMQRLRSPEQRERDLRPITAATLVLLGERELPVFRRCAEIIRRSIPGAQREYLPDVGHLCLLEAPELAGSRLEVHLRAHAQRLPPSAVRPADQLTQDPHPIVGHAGVGALAGSERQDVADAAGGGVVAHGEEGRLREDPQA